MNNASSVNNADSETISIGIGTTLASATPENGISLNDSAWVEPPPSCSRKIRKLSFLILVNKYILYAVNCIIWVCRFGHITENILIIL